MMPRTLYARMALALFLLFALVGASFVVASLYSATMYQQEVAQRLNRDLAMYIVEEHVRVRDGRPDPGNLEQLFHTVMVINPSLELYLLDAEGKVLAFSAAPDAVSRQQVSLAPIRRFLAGEQQLPVLGDDPRHPDRLKAFSVSPILDGERTAGYIYAVLGSEKFDYITQLLQQSYILRISLGAVALALLFGFAGGLFIFARLTRRLRRLSRAMDAFRQQGFDPDSLPEPATTKGDEIDTLTATFHEMAQQIQLQLQQLKQTDALRRELVANVSHDLRTPLASLQGYIETLLRKNDSLDAAQRHEYLQTVAGNADKLNKLVSELFELAKLEAGDLKLHREGFSLAELVHDVTQKFRLRAEQQQIALQVDIDPKVPYVEADIALIERVLDNLIDNALKNTPAGGNIQLKLDARGDVVGIIVADTGRGIAAEELPHIFKRFYKKADKQDAGAGLGLAIAQRIVELHGGQLRVDSMLNRGTRFAFALPAA